MLPSFYLVSFVHKWCCISTSGVFRIHLSVFHRYVRKMSGSVRKNYKDFLFEPMGEKGVLELPGIGDVLGPKLVDAGFDKAYTVFGQFLVLKKDKEKFLGWIKTTVGANAEQGALCYQCLKDWWDAYL